MGQLTAIPHRNERQQLDVKTQDVKHTSSVKKQTLPCKARSAEQLTSANHIFHKANQFTPSDGAMAST